MKLLLNGKDEQSSLGQEILYRATEWRVKTPKSILLPSIVRILRNNTKLTNILNRFGHGVSYALLTETQTENAFQIHDEITCFWLHYFKRMPIRHFLHLRYRQH